MNNIHAAPNRGDSVLAAFEEFDSRIRAWALAQGCDERRFPVLIPAETLRLAEYEGAFPHLLMSAAVASDPAVPFEHPNVRLAPWFLSPAVCYHAYAALAGATLAIPRLFTARGSCFRSEEAAELAPGRRQVEFEMRELILVGPPPWIEERLAVLQPGVEAITADCGLTTAAWQPASDPFFLPRARGKAHMQRLSGAKIELCMPDGLAIASINRHGRFFGERFRIRTADGDCAHSACVAFGLDRWFSNLAPSL